MTRQLKELVQYSTAIATLFSGVIMCFLSFFLNSYDIAGSVLGYFGQTLIFCAGVFGINCFVKNQIYDAETRINEKINEKMRK